MIRGKTTYYYIAFIAIVSALIISGCVSQQPTGTPAPTVVPTTTPTAIPTATPVPTQQPGTSVEVLNAPATAVAGKSFDVMWRVNSPSVKTIPHTAVHYGPESKSEPLTLTSYPTLTQVQNGTIPANFSAKIIINATGITYFRAHAIVDGVNYWSQERTINISGSGSSAKPTATPTPGTMSSGGY
jgi:hypothetical protein